MFDFGELGFPPHKTRELLWEIVRKCAQGAKEWKLLPQPRLAILKDAFRPDKISQPMLTEVAQYGARRQVIAKQISSRSGKNDLASVRRRKHARDAIQALAEKIAIPRLCRSRMNRHPHSNGLVDSLPDL